ncbi:hypothetical protein SAMN02745133_01040 [Desulforamulus putei DSM 12395]|uniref:Uncharacterized protein n=1 Tax=Desulforamulus putei DSM 12395 TaxID=1121429 RepID=A0A1M4VYI3_9FIRM|nr:hypothetical protein SAMN02745133_01040 [Desulforamulus putei DSM 12395]
MRKRGLSSCGHQWATVFGNGKGRRRLAKVREMSVCGKGPGQGFGRDLGLQGQRHQGLRGVVGWLKGRCPFLTQRSEKK